MVTLEPTTMLTPLRSAQDQNTFSAVNTKVSILSILNVLDHWAHRDENSQRVVGALLGSRTNNEYEITDTFPIVLLHNDSSIDVDFALTMLQLRKRANPKEQVLGWYSTGTELDEASPALHDWFEANMILNSSNQLHHGVHLLIDTTLAVDEMSVKGYIGLPISSLNFGHQGRIFVAMQVQVASTEFEQSALEMIAAAAHPENENIVEVPMAFAHDEVFRRVQKLKEMFDNCIDFVSQTIDQMKSSKQLKNANLINQQGHLIAKAIANRTNLSDIIQLDREIRDVKAFVELSLQARKQMMLSEMVTYGGAFKH